MASPANRVGWQKVRLEFEADYSRKCTYFQYTVLGQTRKKAAVGGSQEKAEGAEKGNRC
jgi:hypothetical protein